MKSPTPAAAAPPVMGFALDLALMRRAAAGEMSAQHEVVVRVLSRVRHIVTSLCRAQAEQEDLVQGALVEILGSAQTYRGLSPLSNWADRIAVRHVLTTLRRQRQRRTEGDELIDEGEGNWSEPERLSEDLPRSPAAYLDQLPEGARAILVMRHVLDASLQEIAEEMKLSVPQIKKQLYLAKQRVRRLIRRDRVVGIGLRRTP